MLSIQHGHHGDNRHFWTVRGRLVLGCPIAAVPSARGGNSLAALRTGDGAGFQVVVSAKNGRASPRTRTSARQVVPLFRNPWTLSQVARSEYYPVWPLCPRV